VSERLRAALPAVAGVALFAAALLVLRGELRHLSWHRLTADIVATPPARLLAAAGLTALNYLVLTGYDLLAFATIGRRLARGRVLLASFLAYAIANSVGFAMLSGASVRYRFYTRWGVSAEDLSRIVISYSVTFWLGLLALGGFSLAAAPLPPALPAQGLLRPLGWLLMALCAAYVAFAVVRRGPVRVWKLELPLPRPRIAVAQLAVSALDWTLAAGVLYALLPAMGLPFPSLLAAFLAAQLLALASHVPGGVGVFEGLMVLFLHPYAPSSQVLPVLAVFRVVYYLLPFTLAVIGLVADEVRQRRHHAARLASALGWLTEQLTPRVLAVFTFLAGLGLLLSGATPAAPGRLSWLSTLLPLGVVELSHFVGSLLGAGLLLVSQGLARRLDAAYYLAVGGIAAGIWTSLLKGADFEEAALLGLLLLVLWRARPAFDRKAAFWETRFSPEWTLAVLAALGASVWLGLFAFKHVEYSQELWWQFALQGEASRFLRASVGASIVVALFGLGRLVRTAPPEIPEPTEADLEAVAAAITAQHSTVPFLAFLRDKALLFNDDRTGFVMYGVQGRTWVALGDPVGPPACVPGLIRLFLDRVHDFDGVPVFYEVPKEGLHRYADHGLTFVKLGEEARIDLLAFSLEGPQSAKFRQGLRRLEKEGAHFRILAPEEVAAEVDQLAAVSEQWLREKAGSEKGFSLGFFDREYLARLPVAVLEREGKIVAFANLWPGHDRHELSVDLMRYGAEAPNTAMEGLLVHILLWGKAQGYHWFSLGMAPLSGFELSPSAPFWNRLGTFLFEHGGALYNFQGLRAYKEKFSPVWEPRYLAYPGGLRLPRILADVSALVAGGYRRIFIKKK